jgi:5-methylcytosine-specific restriction endonuclease McrA
VASRSTPEWVGKTPDTGVPPRVRLRIWEATGGRCHICDQKIHAGEKWEADHVTALINGGENRESNLAPAHVTCHSAKTRADVAEKSKVSRMKAKHIGAKQKKPWHPRFKKKLDGSVVDRRTGEPI